MTHSRMVLLEQDHPCFGHLPLCLRFVPPLFARFCELGLKQTMDCSKGVKNITLWRPSTFQLFAENNKVSSVFTSAWPKAKSPSIQSASCFGRQLNPAANWPESLEARQQLEEKDQLLKHQEVRLVGVLVRRMWACGSKFDQGTPGFSPGFHLPGFHLQGSILGTYS